MSTESKFFVAIREDNGQIRAMKSGFPRPLGFVLNVEGTRWKVAHISKDHYESQVFIGTFKKSCFLYFDFNEPNARKK